MVGPGSSGSLGASVYSVPGMTITKQHVGTSCVSLEQESLLVNATPRALVAVVSGKSGDTIGAA